MKLDFSPFAHVEFNAVWVTQEFGNPDKWRISFQYLAPNGDPAIPGDVEQLFVIETPKKSIADLIVYHLQANGFTIDEREQQRTGGGKPNKYVINYYVKVATDGS